MHQIARLSALPSEPAWLKLALSDATNGKSMSINRERRLCAHMGIEPPQRKPYWRPCLPATLTHEQRAQVLALAEALLGKE